MTTLATLSESVITHGTLAQQTLTAVFASDKYSIVAIFLSKFNSISKNYIFFLYVVQFGYKLNEKSNILCFFWFLLSWT